MIDREHVHRLTLAGIGLLQGVVFWIAYDLWPAEPRAAAWSASLVALVAVFGLVVQFAWTGARRSRLLVTASAVAVPFALVTLWVWWQLPGKDAPYQGDPFRQGTFVAASVVALYVLMPFVQVFQESGRPWFPYADLYRHSWNNLFVAAIAYLFAGVFWGLIALWAGLFHLIGVSFFERVFFSAPFSIITLSATNGLGIALGRENDRILNTLRRVSAAVFHALMPLLALIALLFLAALPFTGLKPLWDTRSASPILLTALGLTILFINGIFQDGAVARPYPTWLRRGVEGTLLVAPVFSVLTLYAIGLRIGQYGLMPERLYVVVFALIAGLYSVGYAFAVVRSGDVWMGPMRAVNVGMALLVAAVALLLHTPVLDPLAWSARSQYARLVQGRVDPSRVDYGALRFQLGHAGHARLMRLARIDGRPDADVIRKEVASVRSAQSYYAWSADRGGGVTAGDLKVLTPAGQLPEGLLDAARTTEYVMKACAENKDCVVFAVNVDNDPDDEYVFVMSGSADGLPLYDRTSERRWVQVGELQLEGPARPERHALVEAIKGSRVAAVPPVYRDVKIADWVFGLHRR